MAELVISSGNVVENLESGLVGATDWINLSDGLAEDGLDVYNNFSNGDFSNYLYIRDFGFSLPANAKIDGIEVIVKRRGVGSTNDYYVGLVYGSGEEDYEITAPGKQIEGTWSADYDNVTYGADNDIWNHVWTPEEINSEFFGFAIAINGSTEAGDSGSIDYIELSVHYHHIYSEVADGPYSAPLSGSAFVSFIDYIVPASAGLSAAGHGALRFTEIIGGIARIGGDGAFSEHGYGVTGGIRGAGSATVAVTYPVIPSSGAKCAGAANIRYTANYVGSSGARLNSSAPSEHYYGVTGSILAAGSATLLFTYNYSPSGAARLNGSAFVDPYLATGGIAAAGSATSVVTRSVTATGGIHGAGSATNLVQKQTSGGILLAGESVGGRTHEIPQWDIPLTAAQMVPATESSAVGQLEAWLNSATSQFTYRLTYSGASSTVTSVTFHSPAVTGGTASAVLTVSQPSANPVVGSTILSTTDKNNLLAGNWYVRLNTEDYPNGEIRGQLLHFGAKAAGSALVKPYIEVVRGGALANGTAAVKPYWDAVQGGAKCAGKASVNSVYKDGGLGPTEYSFLCNGSNVMPSIPSETRTALAKIRLDADTNTLHWDIRWNFTGVDWNAVRFRIGSKSTAIGKAFVLVDALQSVAVSPIIGSSIIDEVNVDRIITGQAYLQLREDRPYTELRNQLTNDSGRLSGQARAVAVYNITTSGGGLVASSAAVVQKHNIPAHTNNIAVGGSGAIVSLSVAVSGGAVLNGTAPIIITSVVTPTGGVVGNGSATLLFNYRIIPTGGTIANSSSLIAIQPSISGGAVCAGVAIQRWFAQPVITGGAVVAPSHVKQQTYAAQPLEGGVFCAGRVIGEKIKFFVSIRRGYGAAMASSNILNTLPDTRVRLIDPVGSISPVLDEDRFRMEHSTGWCEVEDRCPEGVLPKVIQRRQKGILPPKLGGNVRRDRRLATAV